jgi:hypothetical protein
MTATLDFSSEFATLVNRLHQSPDDPALKQALVRRLPEMKALAKVNPLALFRLAQIYPKHSEQYQQMMKQSANAGCTNAMLALCHLLLKSNQPNDLKKAAHYINQIEHSNDSYMISHGRSLLETHPQLASELKSQIKSNDYQYASRFFSNGLEREELKPATIGFTV